VAGSLVELVEDSEASDSSEEQSKEESEVEPEEEEEEEPKEEEKKEKELAVQGGIAHGNTDQIAVSCNCICILFCIPVLVM
jgi:hypothetical protein